MAEKFSIVWKQHFPLLTPNFMKVFNETQQIPINSQIVPMSQGVKYDLISELAFNLASEGYMKDINPDEFFENYEKIRDITLKTAISIWRSGNYSDKDLNLNESEIEQTKLLYSNILEFVNKLKIKDCQFKPKLKGYAIIPDLSADVSIDDTLYEIKTVNRNFRSSDLKQLFIYLALQKATGEMKWKYGGLYNPRQGVYSKFNINSLILNLSGGKTSNEAFENLLDSFSRDIQIDSKF